MKRIGLGLWLLAGALAPAQEMPMMPPPADAADLEKAVAANPEDVKARQQLVGIQGAARPTAPVHRRVGRLRAPR